MEERTAFYRVAKKMEHLVCYMVVFSIFFWIVEWFRMPTNFDYSNSNIFEKDGFYDYSNSNKYSNSNENHSNTISKVRAQL